MQNLTSAKLEPWIPQVTKWLADILKAFVHQESTDQTIGESENSSTGGTAEKIFAVLSHRRFTHLSRLQSEKYRANIEINLEIDIRLGRRLHFFYDLGPGYHASLRSDFRDLRIEPGLGELLALRQISIFANEVQRLYAPGVKFGIVIDDLCAEVVNDVPIFQTSAYLEKFDRLIAAVGMQDWVKIVAESRILCHEHFRDSFLKKNVSVKELNLEASRVQIENVSRFVGRLCSHQEVVEYLQRYEAAQAISASMMTEHLSGVRMTQRATDSEFGFRSFAGGDARHQCGEVDIEVNENLTALKPVLTTHVTYGRHLRVPIGQNHLPPAWPLRVGVVHVVYKTVE